MYMAFVTFTTRTYC